MKQLVVFRAWAYNKVGIGVISWVPIHMVNDCAWRQFFANSFLANRNVDARSIPIVSNNQIPALVISASTALPTSPDIWVSITLEHLVMVAAQSKTINWFPAPVNFANGPHIAPESISS